MLHGEISETMHLLAQQGGDQVRGKKPGYIGHIAVYDLSTNTVTVVNPLGGTVDDNGKFIPLITEALPLMQLSVGTCDGQNTINSDIEVWGIQIAPFGGSTQQEPTKGEQVLVTNVRNATGYAMSALLLPNDSAKPPGSADIPVEKKKMVNGEWLFVHPSGTMMHWDNDNNINIAVQRTGNFAVVSNGSIQLKTGEQDTQFPTPANQYDIDIASHFQLNATSDDDTNITAATNINLVATGQDISATAGGDIGLIATGNLNANAVTINLIGSTSINVLAPTVHVGTPGDFQSLCNTALYEWLMQHDHDTPVGPTTTPNSPIPPELALTNALFAN